jgi:hypothetical protein
MRQLAPAEQLSVQPLRLPQCSSQIAPPEQFRMPESTSSASAVQLELPAQLKRHLLVAEQMKLQLQLVPGHDWEQLSPPPPHDSTQHGLHSVAQLVL